MFSLQLYSRNISWQLSPVEGREGGKVVERRDPRKDALLEPFWRGELKNI